jgi:hypothetical protein
MANSAVPRAVVATRLPAASVDGGFVPFVRLDSSAS